MRDAIAARALELGFSHVGFGRADRPLEAPDRVVEWVRQGRHAGMSYLARLPEQRVDPRVLLPAARSYVAVLAPYAPGGAGAAYAAYARSADYHRAVGDRLARLVEFVRANHEGVAALVCVDTRPLLERRAAARAGVGWIGKNTMLMNADLGPWSLLGILLLSIDLPADPEQQNRCGTCERCLLACPTGALVEPYVLDARRCLSYWTIEHRGPAPEWVREAVGGRIFGCDDCLLACPFGPGRPAGDGAVLTVARELSDLDAERTIALLEDGFNRNFKRFALARAGKAGLLRNGLTVLGNSGDRDHAATVERYVEHENEGVRSHARWALEKLRGNES